MRLELFRIGDKLVSKNRIDRRIEQILNLRSSGLSQQDVADQLGVDRTFISRLESMGELRKGGRLALIGFPIGNKEEVERIAREEGIEFLLLFDDKERWSFVSDVSGPELFNRIMEWVSHLREFDAIIFIGSDMRIKLAEAVLGPEIVVGISLGPSPIEGDRTVSPEMLTEVIRSLRV